ncbi:hypothetical protein M9458_039092, partial [Cirrhinus mrigala]
VLLKNVTTVSLPSVMDPLAFESVLNSAYTGQLSIVRDDIINYVTVASFLQMWHIVDKCTDILKSPGGATSSDCCFADPEDGERAAGEQTLEKRPQSALPPLATWRRPTQSSPNADRTRETKVSKRSTWRLCRPSKRTSRGTGSALASEGRRRTRSRGEWKRTK